MSAIAKYELFREVEEGSEEAEALRAIGRAAARTPEGPTSVGEVMEAALSAPGLRKINFEGGKLIELFGPLSWSLDGSTARAFSSIPISVNANGREWGQLRVWFDSKVRPTETAHRFGQFLGQQLGRYACQSIDAGA